jgi:hypothetical protein
LDFNLKNTLDPTGAVVWTGPPSLLNPSGTLDNAKAEVAAYIDTVLQYQRDTYSNGDPGVIWYGMVADSGGRVRGRASSSPGWEAAGPTGPTPYCSPICWDNDGSYGDWQGLHEIGHTLGRSHVACTGTEATPDPLYPYAGGKIGGPAANPTQFYGFDAGDARWSSLPTRVVPNTYADNMSYCPYEWISDYTYKGIRDYVQAEAAIASVAGAGQTLAATTPSRDLLSLYGWIDLQSQRVQIPIASRQSTVGVVPTRVPGPYHIRLFDSSNVLLADYPFTPQAGSDEPSLLSFAQVVDFIPGTRRVTIYSDKTDRELGSLPVSQRAPTVTITSRSGGPDLPGSGPVTLKWSGFDLDGDSVTYSVLYSPNGRTSWRGLVVGTSDSEITLLSDQLEGTRGPTGYLRVVGSDGVLTGIADSDPFSVLNKSPEVHVTSLASGSSYPYGALIPLQGVAQDVEDGTLDDRQLRWVSDRSGVLGRGPLIHVRGLAIGKHTITLSATDSAGAVGSTSVQITVVGTSCVADEGPGIPPPLDVPSGLEGFHAAWYGQSGYLTLCPGQRAMLTAAFLNTGSRGWLAGQVGEAPVLGTWTPVPGQDRPSVLGGDGTNTSPSTGWLGHNRAAQQPASYVGPNQVAWFRFAVQAPAAPGTYQLYVRPLIEGREWFEDYGVFFQITVRPAG